MCLSIRATQRGFTIVELLIVIVVIGILAAVVIAVFNGIQSRAKVTTLTSDLTNASKQLRLDHANAGKFPAAIGLANNGKGLQGSPNTTYRYSVDNTANPQSFCLTATDGGKIYSVTDTTNAAEGGCVNVALGASSPSSLIVDGNTNSNSSSYYLMPSGSQSVTVTLSSVQLISRVKIWHYYTDSRTYNGSKTEISEDGSNWVKIHDSATSGTYQETSAGKTHSFNPQKVRYIRDWINGSNINASNHWVEIQAF